MMRHPVQFDEAQMLAILLSIKSCAFKMNEVKLKEDWPILTEITTYAFTDGIRVYQYNFQNAPDKYDP